MKEEKEPAQGLDRVHLWACAAHCADLREREVLGVYARGRLLLVSRPWLGVLNLPIHHRQLGSTLPLLQALVAAADYHEDGGFWFGEVAVPVLALAATGGYARNTLHCHLTKLRDAGYIFYRRAEGNSRPAHIRVYPNNAKTDDHVLAVDPTWVRGFIRQITPKVLHSELWIEKRHPKLRRCMEATEAPEMVEVVSKAPILISEEAVPKLPVPGVQPLLPGNRALLNAFKDVPGVLAAHVGGQVAASEPDQKEPIWLETPSTPEWGREWNEGGLRCKIEFGPQCPKLGQVGVDPTWGRGCRRPSHSNDHDGLDVSLHRGASPNIGLAPRAEPSAPPPPPAGAPPLAAALLVAVRSGRQLQPRWLDRIFKERGRRVLEDAVAGESINARQRAAIEAYERLCAVPFCKTDLPHLEEALKLSTDKQVRRAIKACAYDFPEDNPGYYVVRDGMAHVLNHIRENPVFRAHKKGSPGYVERRRAP